MHDAPRPGESAVALDFDGVVWDSVDEAFEIAWHTWTRLHAPLPTPKDDMRRRFREARWQCKDGHDFYVVMHLLAASPPGDVGRMSAEAFREVRMDPEVGLDSDRFVEAFYARRAEMRDTDREAWLSLQRPYPGVVEQVKQMQATVRGVAIATTKDAESARALLELAGLGDLPIFGREVSLDKRDHMRAIARTFDIPVGRIAFVDDLLENLLPLAPLGVSLGLAGWGYNTPEEQRRAETLGIPVMALDTLARQVGTLLGPA